MHAITQAIHTIQMVWNNIIQTMQLNSQIFENLHNDHSFLITIPIIAFLSGISLLVGQSIALFINRVKPKRFAFLIILNGLIYLLSLYIWTLAMWIGCRIILHIDTGFFTIAQVTFLGSIPFLFGFFILLPFVGIFISHILHVWSFIIVLIGMTYTFHITILQSFGLVSLGWLMMLTFNQIMGRPFLTFNTMIWYRSEKHAIENISEYLHDTDIS